MRRSSVNRERLWICAEGQCVGVFGMDEEPGSRRENNREFGTLFPHNALFFYSCLCAGEALEPVFGATKRLFASASEENTEEESYSGKSRVSVGLKRHRLFLSLGSLCQFDHLLQALSSISDDLFLASGVEPISPSRLFIDNVPRHYVV